MCPPTERVKSLGSVSDPSYVKQHLDGLLFVVTNYLHVAYQILKGFVAGDSALCRLKNRFRCFGKGAIIDHAKKGGACSCFRRTKPWTKLSCSEALAM